MITSLPETRSEKQIQHAIKKVLKSLGFECWDTSQPFRAAITPGVPDLIVAGHGVVVFIEVKTAKGKQSMPQEWFQRLVEGNGGKYLLARSEADVIEWARPLVNRTGLALNRIPIGHATWTEP